MAKKSPAEKKEKGGPVKKGTLEERLREAMKEAWSARRTVLSPLECERIRDRFEELCVEKGTLLAPEAGGSEAQSVSGYRLVPGHPRRYARLSSFQDVATGDNLLTLQIFGEDIDPDDAEQEASYLLGIGPDPSDGAWSYGAFVCDEGTFDRPDIEATEDACELSEDEAFELIAYLLDWFGGLQPATAALRRSSQEPRRKARRLATC